MTKEESPDGAVVIGMYRDAITDMGVACMTVVDAIEAAIANNHTLTPYDLAEWHAMMNWARSIGRDALKLPRRLQSDDGIPHSTAQPAPDQPPAA